MPLTMANPGECYTIRKVGGNVTVVSEIDGNLIVNVKDSMLPAEKEIAAKILI